jgi:uncharacterized membrane protein YccC
MENTLKDSILGPLREGIRYALIALLTFSVARYFTVHIIDTSHYAPIGALWAMITGMVVLADTYGSTVAKARLQILGGLFGAIAGFIYLSFLPFSLFGMVVMILLVVSVCQATQLSGISPGAAMNTGVILVFSSLNPELTPIMNSGLRLIEMAIGCGFAIIIAWLLSGVPGTEA